MTKLTRSIHGDEKNRLIHIYLRQEAVINHVLTEDTEICTTSRTTPTHAHHYEKGCVTFFSILKPGGAMRVVSNLGVGLKRLLVTINPFYSII